MRQLYLLFGELKWASSLSQNQKVSTPSNPNQKVATPKTQSLKSLYLKEDFKQKVATLNKDISINLLSTLNLTWSHYKEILSISNKNEVLYYIKLVMTNHLSVRELRDRIKSKEYYRLDENTRNKLIKLEETDIIICKKNNKFVIEYCSDERIITREYKLI